MSIVLDGTAGITTPEITSAGGPLVVNASAPDSSVVVDAGGAVLMGTPTSPSSNNMRLSIAGRSGSASNGGMQLITDGGGGGALFSNDGAGLRIFSFTGAAGSESYTERARIDSSGRLLVGGTSERGRVTIDQSATSGNSNALGLYANNDGGTFNMVVFLRYDTRAIVGSITSNGTSTSYNTSSDYRLKENIAPMTGALARVSALKPVTYTWKADGSADEGFIAHELQEVCPSAVTGEKDGVETYKDENGVEQTRPKYQGIDTSFLVATLTAAIQEQQALIESLTARVVALENQIV